ncbi:thioesterase family protein, partial [Nannochloropsis gaditana CCMP526]
RIRLSSNPKLDRDMEMTGRVVWTGSSSMQIDLEVHALPDAKPWISASFTFVARHPQTAKATAINKLKPESAAERETFSAVEQKNQRRKTVRKAKGTEGSPSLKSGAVDVETMIKL